MKLVSVGVVNSESDYGIAARLRFELRTQFVILAR